MSDPARIVPSSVVMDIEMFIDKELSDSRQYDNREPLDDSGVWSLHALAARIYAAGWRDGERAQAERERGQRQREREAARADQRAGVSTEETNQ